MHSTYKISLVGDPPPWLGPLDRLRLSWARLSARINYSVMSNEFKTMLAAHKAQAQEAINQPITHYFVPYGYLRIELFNCQNLERALTSAIRKEQGNPVKNNSKELF